MEVCEDIKVTLNELELNDFDARLVENGEKAKALILESVPAGASVGARAQS